MSQSDIITEFKKHLGTMSHSRAGWDYQLPPQQKALEDRQRKEALSAARKLWSDNPDRQEDLRKAFVEFRPLATMDEIAMTGHYANRKAS